LILQRNSPHPRSFPRSFPHGRGRCRGRRARPSCCLLRPGNSTSATQCDGAGPSGGGRGVSTVQCWSVAVAASHQKDSRDVAKLSPRSRERRFCSSTLAQCTVDARLDGRGRRVGHGRRWRRLRSSRILAARCEAAHGPGAPPMRALWLRARPRPSCRLRAALPSGVFSLY